MFLAGKYKNKKNDLKLAQTVNRIKKHYKSLRSAWRLTDMHWSQFHRCTKLYKRKQMVNEVRKKYVRKLHMDDIKSIENFFQTDDTSFPLPDKKHAGKRFLKHSVSKSCKMYNLLASTRRKIAESTFRKYKPNFVKLQGKIPLRQSCCEVCQNFDFVMAHACKYLTGVPSTLDECVDSSLCKYSGYFPDIKCVLRECDKCGLEKVANNLKLKNEHKLNDRKKRFIVKKWISKKEKIPNSNKYRNYMHWDYNRFSYSELLEQYVNSLESMAGHTFFAAWNFHQYLVCKNNLEEGQIVVVHDYAQNYLCVFQHEVQAMHWCHAQVTIHPSCISYRCPVDGCNQLVLHEIVHISDDTKHDAHLVKRFQSANYKILEKRGVRIRKIVEFTDQAPSQFKNKSAFRYLSEEQRPCQRNFFGVRHGKGPCDACAGRFKSRLSTLVKTGTCVVDSPKTCYEAAKNKLESTWPQSNECAHYMMNFNYTPKIGTRPNTDKWKGVLSTRHHMHSIMNTGKKLQVNVRDVMCMCSGCLHGDSECKQPNYIDEWRGFDMDKFKQINADLNLWKSIKIRKTVGGRDDYAWEDVRDILAGMVTFEEVVCYVQRNPLPFFDFHINETLLEEDRDFLDLVALHYKPTDAPEGFVPCKIQGDGNCFPRSLSFICFKLQDMHVEMRVRLIYEAVLNMHYYISNRYLSRGCNIVYRRGGPSKQLAMYASSYRAEQILNIPEVYKKEVLEITKDGAYCGLWQMAQAANILRRPIQSVYPEGLHDGMRLDFNRKFMCIDNKYNNREPVKIMWTPMQISHNSYPVHFVPLLKAVSVKYVNYV